MTIAASPPRRRLRLPRLGQAALEYVGFLPALVLLGLFFLVPLAIIVCYSFWETVNYSVVHHWTTDNYRYFFSVTAYVSTMWATPLIAAALSDAKAGLPVKKGSIKTAVPPKSRRKAEWPNQVICMGSVL